MTKFETDIIIEIKLKLIKIFFKNLILLNNNWNIFKYN